MSAQARRRGQAGVARARQELERVRATMHDADAIEPSAPTAASSTAPAPGSAAASGATATPDAA